MKKNIRLFTKGFLHPSFLATNALRSLLNEIPEIEYTETHNFEDFIILKPDETHAVILYFHEKDLPPMMTNALINYTAKGGGILAIHGASASFKTNKPYQEFLGGKFVFHGAVKPFRIIQKEKQDDIFGSIPPFEIIDELYLHEYNPENSIHFQVEAIEGEFEPFVWTRKYEKGRICYCAAGHTRKAIHHPSIRQILKKGLLWAAGGNEEVNV